MFRLLLKVLGLEKHEYPENNKPINRVQESSQPSFIETQLKSQSGAELKPEPKKKIESKPEIKTELKPEIEPEPTQEILTTESLIHKFSELKSNYAKMLIDAGFDDLKKIKTASDKELLSIKGIGKATLQILRKNC